MAENIEKKILIKAKVLDNFISAKQNAEKWRKALKDAEKDGTKTAEDLRAIAENLADANVKYREAKKELESASKSQSLLNEAQDKTVKTLGQMQRELTSLRNMPFTGLDEKQIQSVKQKMADLTSEIQDYKVEIKGLDTGEVFKNTAEGIEMVVASASALGNTLKMFGVDSEILGGLEDKTVELIAAVQALGVVTEYLEKRKLKLLTANLKNISAMISEKVAATAGAIAMGLLGKSADKTSLSFKILRGAIIATGIGLLVAAIGGLIAYWDNLTSWIKKSTTNVGGFGKALNKLKEIAVGVYKVVESYLIAPFKSLGKLLKGDVKGAFKEYINSFNVVGNYQKGATEQMARNHEKYMQGVSERVRKAKSEQLLSDAEKLEKSLEVDRAMGASAEDLYKKEMEILSKKVEGYKWALSNIKDKNSEAYKEMEKNLNDAMQQQKVAQATETKRLADAGKERAGKAQEQFLKELELKKTYDIARLKSEAKYQSDDFATKQNYAKRIFELENQSEIDKLTAERKFGKITENEYRKQLSILESARAEFENTQANESNNYYKEKQKELLGLLKENTDAEIASVKEKYATAIKELGEMQAPIKMAGQSEEDYQKEMRLYEDFVTKKALLTSAYEKQEQEEIDEIKRNSAEKRISDIEKAIEQEYAGDFAKFSDNERKKTETEIEMLQEQIERKKAAGIEVYEDEAKLRAAKNNLDQLDLNIELLSATENARAKYEARKIYLQKELELYKNNADRIKEINAEIRENEKEYHQAKIAEMEKWANRTMDILTEMNALANALADAEIQKWEDANERKKAGLKKRLDEGLISEQEYNRLIEQSDANLDKKKAEIARKQAIREKALKSFEIIINTASAIMKLWVNPGFSGAIPLAVSIAALGALQLATVAATPIPKARRGMWLQGASHEQGGVLIEAEGGEAIINKRSAAMFAPLLSAINQAGGGVPFMRPMSDGGYSVRNIDRSSSGISAHDVRDAMREAISELKIYTTVEDIRREDRKYTEVEQRATY